MKIETTRFGTLEIGEEHLIDFKDGMIGFSKLKQYVLVESQSMPLLLWLQSTLAPDIAFPLIEPYFFKRDYKPALSDADKHCLNFKDGDATKIFVVLTIPTDMTKMTVNLKAPIILDIPKATGTQLILQDKNLDLRVPAHEPFTKALSNFTISQSSADFNSDEDSWSAVNVRKEKAAVIAGL